MVVIILDGILEKRGNAVVKVFKERYCAILDEHGQLSFVYWKSKGHKYPKVFKKKYKFVEFFSS